MHLTVSFPEVGYAVLIGSWVVKDGGLWSGGVIRSGCLVWRWWSDLMVWVVVWSGADLIDWFHSLISRSVWGRSPGLWAKFEKMTSWVNNSEMAKLSVRELRKEKRRKKYGNSLFFEIRCNFEKPALNRKRFAKNQLRFRYLLTIIVASSQALYFLFKVRRARVMKKIAGNLLTANVRGWRKKNSRSLSRARRGFRKERKEK